MNIRFGKAVHLPVPLMSHVSQLVQPVDMLYTRQQAQLMWDAVAYNDSREFAFFTGKKWLHPKQYFATCEQFYDFIKTHFVKDVHVKALNDNGGREWVIDVDFKDQDEAILIAKILIAKDVFVNFFGDNVSRIMHSGNRGLHVWLRIDRFRLSADKSVRQKYYKTFVAPKFVRMSQLQPGSFAHAIHQAVLSNPSIVQQYFSSKSIEETILLVWPAVDQHVFCNLNQIRAPFSYNFKGRKFSYSLL